MSRVAVAGSLNCDFVMRVDRHPAKGETVLATTFDVFVGGKGNNQALASARAGADVAMIGRVGKDVFGDDILAKLIEARVDCRFVVRDAEGTGVAGIFVDAAGDNSIAIAPRANGRLSPADIEAASPAIEAAGALLLQLEIPIGTALAAARLARAGGVLVILNPAPAPPTGLPRELLEQVDILVPNQSEAATLTGIPSDDVAGAEQSARSLRRLGPRSVIVTMGEAGALVVAGDGPAVVIPSFEVAVVDTTAAGDAFSGALAAALAEEIELRAAVVRACAAGALACTRRGAEPSLPSRAEIDALVRSRPHIFG